MSSAGRVVRTAGNLVRALRTRRIEVMPLIAFCVLIAILGDDLVLWLVQLVSTGAHGKVAALGGGMTTVLFGILPAMLLAAVALGPLWRECWRATRD